MNFNVKYCKYIILITSVQISCVYHDLPVHVCAPVEANVTVIPESDCFSVDGSITIDIAKNTALYRYSFKLQSPVSIPVFRQLSAGRYYIEIIDKKNCKTGMTVDVPRNHSNVSWLNDIKPVIETRCSKPACHGGNNRVLFGSYETVKIYAQQIKFQVAGRSMPQDGQLADDQIKKIVCWVESGAPEN